MITLNTDVLRPIRKLETLELANEYWKCNSEFIAVESWIISRGIKYEVKCKNKGPKMFEKIISAVTPADDDVEDDYVFPYLKPKNDTIVPVPPPKKPLTPFQKFDQEFSSFQAFILGMEIGLGVGIVATYIWLRAFCKCRQLNCAKPKTRRQMRRQQRIADTDATTSLLWTTIINPDLETPPLYRRQLLDNLPEGNAPYPTYGLPGVVEAGLQIDAIRLPDRAETPPPAYNECRIVM